MSPSSHGDALAWQLIELLKAGRIRAGDVLIDRTPSGTAFFGVAERGQQTPLAVGVAQRRRVRGSPSDPSVLVACGERVYEK